jgi:hypothetical protein
LKGLRILTIVLWLSQKKIRPEKITKQCFPLKITKQSSVF